jgi:predicted amidohydrolase YtcJ
VAINAIGDVAMIIALNAYECALTMLPVVIIATTCDHRHRIERVEAVHSRLPECFAHLGVVATMQSCFTFWEEGDVIPLERGSAPWGHAWGALQRAGVVLANGSNTPVAPDVAPLQEIAATMTHTAYNSRHIVPYQVIGLMDAIRSYTWDNADAAFAERDQGAPAPGRYADISGLSESRQEIELQGIAHVGVVMTSAGGTVVYEQ